jgi:hypothetical protein
MGYNQGQGANETPVQLSMHFDYADKVTQALVEP